MPRCVEPEWLDTLRADDPRALRSRRDLRRINRLMRNPSVLGAALDGIVRRAARTRLVEIGAGDGSLLLGLARRHAKRWRNVSVELLDMQPVVRAETLGAFRELGWNARVIGADVFDWLAQAEPDDRPIVVANLFMHHFKEQPLRELLQGIAGRAHAFVCCEPRRSRLALAGSRLLGAIGCNDVTRHDAVVSVRAGFSGNELSELWPRRDEWTLHESWAAPFGHRFVAVLNVSGATR
jgi:hypothetical protein